MCARIRVGLRCLICHPESKTETMTAVVLLMLKSVVGFLQEDQLMRVAREIRLQVQ